MNFQGFVAGGHRWNSVLDFSVDEEGGTRQQVLEDFVNNATGLFQTYFVQNVHQSVNFTGAVWLDIDSLSGAGGIVTPRPGKPVYGVQSGAALTPNACFLIKKQCTHTRRQRTGRMYFPGVPEGWADDAGTLSSTAITNLGGAAQGFRQAIIDLEDPGGPTYAWRVVHISNYSGISEPGWPNGRPTAWSSSDVTAAVLDTKVATQRRRLR